MAKSARSLWSEKIKSGFVSNKSFEISKKSSEALNSRTQFYGTVLGIDPSLRGTGLAVVKYEKNSRPVCLDKICVRNKPTVSMPDCLANIYRNVCAMIIKHDIKFAAIESSIYVQNIKIAVILGSSRGAAIAAVACNGASLHEYAPLRIKQAVIGFGRASKEQIIKTVQGTVANADDVNSDEADAIATALTHIYTFKG